jgi:hypothetical protein
VFLRKRCITLAQPTTPTRIDRIVDGQFKTARSGRMMCRRFQLFGGGVLKPTWLSIIISVYRKARKRAR